MKNFKKRFLSVVLRWLVLFLALDLLFLFLFFSARPLILLHAKSSAESIMLSAADKAIISVLSENNISYNDISRVSRNSEGEIIGIEIDIEFVNLLKSSVSGKINEIIDKNRYYNIDIPLGTLLGNEYTSGLGPKLNFKMQLTHTAKLDFESRFLQAGINNVLHQIIIKIDISASVLVVGDYENLTVSTTAIAAQTVIAGKVPDAFTNVDEYPGGDIADEIFNYADLY